LNNNYSPEAITNRLEIDRFQGPNADCIHIYTNNKDVRKHNHNQLTVIGNPINKICAKHDCARSKQRESDLCDDLPSVLYLSIGSSVMLLRNVNTVQGLVNGACGTVKDLYILKRIRNCLCTSS